MTDIADDTTLELAEVSNIAGIKDATGNLERAKYVLKNRPEGFAVYSGDDPTAMELCLLGGDGDISVTANVAPRLMSQMVEHAMAGIEQRLKHSTISCWGFIRNYSSNPIQFRVSGR